MSTGAVRVSSRRAARVTTLCLAVLTAVGAAAGVQGFLAGAFDPLVSDVHAAGSFVDGRDLPAPALALAVALPQTVAVVLGLRRHRWAPDVGLAAGAVLVAWVTLQLPLIGWGSPVQWAFLGVGVVEVVAWGLPPGLGSHSQGDRRLDARLAGALMGIQAIKGVEMGDGFGLARRRGSAAHDEILPGAAGIQRATHHSGGTEGGMSPGEVLRVRAAMKPIATVPRALRTIDTSTGEAAAAHHQRSDVCAVPAAGVVAEAMVALVLAEAVLEKFGGDSVGETRRNAEGYLADVAARGLRIDR